MGVLFDPWNILPDNTQMVVVAVFFQTETDQPTNRCTSANRFKCTWTITISLIACQAFGPGVSTNCPQNASKWPAPTSVIYKHRTRNYCDRFCAAVLWPDCFSSHPKGVRICTWPSMRTTIGCIQVDTVAVPKCKSFTVCVCPCL